MSGEAVTFVGDAMVGVVHAVNVVAEITERRPVVVGGLAVMCRLSNPYRSTIDLDVVDRPTAGRPTQLEILNRGKGTEPVPPSAVLVPTSAGMIKVDVLAVNQAEIDNPSVDPGDRLHASAHAWANDSASEVSMTVLTPTTGVSTEATALVAHPGPLVAMKLQAIMNRTNDKEGTDLLDIVRLTLDRHCQQALLEQLASCNDSMAADITLHVVHWFERRKAWSHGRIRAAGGGDVTNEDLDLVRELLLTASHQR